MDTNVITDFIEKKLAQPAENQSYANVGNKDFAKGAIAGLVGGIVATAAKTAAERLYPPRVHGEPQPPEVLADKVAGHELAVIPKTVAAEGIHWTFGAVAGATYGVLAEFYPAATNRDGASFGMTLMALTHEGALPALGLSAQPEDQTTREKSSEMVTHVVFGIVTETVRRFVRARLG
jgi:putative membrane protein